MIHFNFDSDTIFGQLTYLTLTKGENPPDLQILGSTNPSPSRTELVNLNGGKTVDRIDTKDLIVTGKNEIQIMQG